MPPHEQAQKHLDKANELAANEKFNAAFAEFESAISRHYGNPRAHADFGSALLAAGRFPEAVEQFRKAIEFDPAYSLDVDELAQALLHDVRQEQDLVEFQKTVAEGDRAELFHIWAQVLAILQRGDRAIEQFKTALKKNYELELNTDRLMQAFKDSRTIEQQVTEFQADVDTINNEHAWNTWGKTLLGLGRPALAGSQFEKATRIRKDWAEPYLNWGSALTAVGDHEQAIKAFSKAVRCDEHSVNAYLHLGRALNQIGEHQKAVFNYKRAAAKAPSKEYLNPWLNAIKQLPDPDLAIAEYQQALEKIQHDYRLTLNFAKFLQRRGRLAESSIQFARSMVSGHKTAASQLQNILSDLEDPQTTIQKIQEIVDQTNDPYWYSRWGRMLCQIDEIDSAMQQLSKALTLLPGMRRPFESLNPFLLAFKSSEHRYLAQRKIEEALGELKNGKLEIEWARLLRRDLNEHERALAVYRNVLLMAPTSDRLVEDFTEALRASHDQASIVREIQTGVTAAAKAAVSYHWALILLGLGKQKPAIQELQRAIHLEPDYAGAHYQLAQLYDQQGNYKKASSEFKKTVDLDHDRLHALETWGTTLLKTGRTEETIQKYLQVVGEQPGRLLVIRDKLNWDDDLITRFQKVFDEVGTAESYQEWGILLRGIQRPELAIQQFKHALTLDPDSQESYSEWLKTIGLLGLSDELLRDYEQAIQKYRNNADAYYQLGNFLFELKRSDQAAEKCRQALERDPKHIPARSSRITFLMDANDFYQARKEAEQLLVDDPTNSIVFDCFSWIAFLEGNYHEAIKQCELGIENGASFLYGRCTRALYKAGREDLARRKIEEAIEKNPDDAYTHYERGYALLEMNRDDEAAAAFRTLVALKPDHAFANHNLAAITYDQGRYEEAWSKWMHAIQVYEQHRPLLARVIEKDEYVDSYESFYHASIVLGIQHKPQEAEAILKEGLEFDPYNASILRALAELNWERNEELVGLDSDTTRQKSDYYWQGVNYFQRAEQLLKERLKRFPNRDLLTELGDLYMAHEDYAQARRYFEEARAKDDTDSVPYAKLGVIELRERKADTAIALLKEALKRNPDDLDLKSSLAEAYLRAEKLDDAETTYRQVLAIAPYHVQSSIGLGEACSALGDKKEYDRYTEAIEHFTKALDVAKNERIRSKYLKAQEKAGVYYQLGYARVQSYENLGIRRDTKLLEQARKDFDSCIKSNPSHQKAIRAKEKIDKRLVYFSRDRLTETIGPRTIYWMSIIIFVAVQFAFFVMPFFNRPSLIVSDKSLQALAEQASPEALQNLATLKNQKFSNREELSNAVKPLLKSDVEKVAAAVLKNAEAVKPVENFPNLDGGYYALLTFGSLLFMVVGLYLPQILKLRVAGIELEKSSVDQAATGGTLGISK